MKILIIDDEEISLTKTNIIMAPLGVTTLAHDGQSAIDFIKEAISEDSPYDLIIMDINLPDIKGQELLIKINEIENKNSANPAKKIVISAHEIDDEFANFLNDGNNKFLMKPIKKNTLNKLIEELTKI